jgi:MiaB/RimO family radical SAM methylthiotransferase
MLRRLAGFSGRELYVTGCMPNVQREAILAVCSPVFIPFSLIHDLYRPLGTVARASVGIVQLAQGCTGHCTYCLTRIARGPLKSFPADEILDQVRAQVRAGTVEIQLTAQDVSAWGMDTGESLPELLASIDRIPGSHRLRTGMMNPATAKGQAGELAEALSGSHYFRFVHLPVQSGSDEVLRMMGRDYTVADFEHIVRIFRGRNPDTAIATDMIVGFPHESREDFTASLDLIRRIRPAKVNVTRYSRRPFTPVFRQCDFPDSVKKDRSRIMNAVAEGVYTALNAPRLGKIVTVTVTEILRPGSVMARSPDYTGILLFDDLPVGFTGEVILREDRKFFFIGERYQPD